MTHLALRATGQAPKRRLIPRQLPPDRFLAEVETWIRAEYPDAVRTTETRTADGGVRELAIGFHPAAADVVISAGDKGGGGRRGRRVGFPPGAADVVISAGEDGEIGVRADFPPVGPGYQTFVGRLAQ